METKTRALIVNFVIYHMQQSSFLKEIWKRFAKKRSGVFGPAVIILAIFVAVFGYLIAPDATPNADMQTVEIQAKKPGYTQEFLRIPDDQHQIMAWYTVLLSGRKDNYRYLPIT